MADLSTTKDSTDDVATSDTDPTAAPEADDTTPSEAAPASDNSESIDTADTADSAKTPPAAGDAAPGSNGTAPEPADVAADSPKQAPRSRWTVLVAGLSTLLVALLVATVALFVQNTRVDDLAAQRPVVMDAARKVALDLTTTSPDTAGQRIQSLIQGSTGQFRNEISATSAAFETILKQSEVSSSAIVTAAGIEQLQADTATALVSVTIAITNNEAPQGTVQRAKMAVQLQRDGDRWLVSAVEYVS